jgi:methylene-tetrahydromethanopterin dehydrogenase
LAEPLILHMLSPLRHVSPFDASMALDAGYDAVIPYTHVEVAEVRGLVQDAMFSRPPKLALRTAFFIGGKNATLALAMLKAAKEAMFAPFEVSVLADPAGSFTTAAAMVALVERTLQDRKGRALAGLRVAVFGATGVVGFASAVICAQAGAKVTLVGYDGPDRVKRSAEEIKKRFDVDADHSDGSTEAQKAEILADADVVFSTAKAGLQVISKALIDSAPDLLAIADVNAVPPAGVEGLDLGAKGEPVGAQGALGIGPMTVGNVKYKTEAGLFRRMIEAKKAVALDFRHAFVLAREIVAGDG